MSPCKVEEARNKLRNASDCLVLIQGCGGGEVSLLWGNVAEPVCGRG